MLSMTAPSGSTVVERVLAIVEKAFDGDPPGLALVDFTSGASTTLSRGAGHVRLAGPGRVLSLDGGTDPDELAPRAASSAASSPPHRVELQPISAKVAPAHHAQEVEAPRAGRRHDRRHPGRDPRREGTRRSAAAHPRPPCASRTPAR